MDKVQIGQHAAALLEDELLRAIFAAIAERYKAEFEKAPRGDTEKMRLAHDGLFALKDVLAQLHAHLGSAKMYMADLEAAERRQQQKDINNLHG